MPVKCKGICDGVREPTDQKGYKDQKYCYCSTCAKACYTDEKRHPCCGQMLRRKRRYNPMASSKIKTKIILEIKN